MRRILLLLYLPILVLLCFPPGLPARSPDQFMPLDQLERGMKGMGRTVFQGTKIDTFQVEIIGVLRNYLGPGGDMILARLEGEPLEKTGVMPGMSGSPVYVMGKLIGAVGYTWSFAKEPIAGITPIQGMIDLFDREETSDLNAGLNDHLFSGLLGAGSQFDASTSGELQPVATPLVMSGFAPQTVSDLRKELLPLGLFPIQGGGGTDPDLPVGTFEPGAAVGIQLVRGDFSMTGIGTLTYRDGDRVLALGHPMLSVGSTSLPMTSAYIHGIMPSQFLSFKMGTATAPRGEIVQDRSQGVAGRIGETPAMMPAQIEITSAGDSRRFNIEVLNDRDFGPILLRTALASAIISSEKLTGETTVAAKARISVTGRSPLVFENVYAGPAGLGLAVLGLTTPFNRLLQNPYEEIHIESVTYTLEVEEDARAGRIESVRLDKTHIEAGDSIGMVISVRKYLGDIQKIDATLKIPEQTDDQRLVLHIASARSYLKMESKRVPDEYRAKHLEHLFRILGRVEKNDTLILQLLSARAGVTVEGREVSTLPPSVVSAMKLSRESGSVRSVRQTILKEVRIPTDSVLSGSQTVVLLVGREKNGVIFAGKAGPTGGKK